METHLEAGVERGRNIRTWLFNPFHYVAGGKALAVGVVLVLGSSFVGSLSNSHFDGVLDYHTGLRAPWWVFLSEGLIAWLVMGVLLLFGGKVISASRVRVVDVFGTQALARAPMFVVALLSLLPGVGRFVDELMKIALDPGADPLVVAQQFRMLLTANMADTVVFGLHTTVGLVMLVWMIALMYRAYSVSCNITGKKAVLVFIPLLILGEVISKIVLFQVFRVAGL